MREWQWRVRSRLRIYRFQLFYWRAEAPIRPLTSNNKTTNGKSNDTRWDGVRLLLAKSPRLWSYHYGKRIRNGHLAASKMSKLRRIANEKRTKLAKKTEWKSSGTRWSEYMPDECETSSVRRYSRSGSILASSILANKKAQSIQLKVAVGAAIHRRASVLSGTWSHVSYAVCDDLKATFMRATILVCPDLNSRLWRIFASLAVITDSPFLLSRCISAQQLRFT